MKIIPFIVSLFLASSLFASDSSTGTPEPPITTPVEGQAVENFKPQILPDSVPSYLQDVSVTVHSRSGTGSGVLVSRDGITYVWTAAHVIDANRTVREIIDPKTGSSKSIVEFSDVDIVKELIEDGRAVGQVQMTAEVLRYSNSETGQDLALLKIRKKDYTIASTQFYLGKTIPDLGTKLYHVGSLKGQVGSNSMTTGIVSQIGRLLLPNNGVVFDQSTVSAFPGSSGGGVFLEDGRYMGMLVRGGGETFNFIVPIRRMREWADRVGVSFTLDENLPVPTEEELKSRPVEDAGSNIALQQKSSIKSEEKFIIKMIQPDVGARIIMVN